MDEGSVMDPIRSSEMPSPLLPVLPVLSLRGNTCQSPVQGARLSKVALYMGFLLHGFISGIGWTH